MPAYTCPHCQESFTAPATSLATRTPCPHCQQPVEVPATAASRWFIARDKQKLGPYTWQQLLRLAQRGDVKRDQMILQEGHKHWVRADSVPDLAAGIVSAATAVSTKPLLAPERRPGHEKQPVKNKPTARSAVPWLIAGLAAAGMCVLLSISIVGAWFFVRFEPQVDQKHADNLVKEDKKTLVDEGERKAIVKPGKDVKLEVKKTPLPEKKPAAPAPGADADKFVERLNLFRKAAGLGPVALDPELSKGCQAHAHYLARNLDVAKPDTPDVYEEDPKKVGYSVEGERAAHNALVSLQAPLPALERWMGRLASRVPLLSPEMQTIGVGSTTNERGNWFCVVDTQRGRGEPIIVFPAANQTEVPISFAGGPDIPDDKGAAGFPVSVSFPSKQQVTAAQIALHDASGKNVEGWTWTPAKPPRPGQKLNALGFIARTHLLSNTLYQVKASAQVDGKPWSLAWSFTTDDDSDSKGIWAKRALDKVNAYRAGAGLKPVVLDDRLSTGCLKHARYLVINEGHPSLLGLKAHEEDEKLPGYSKEGHDAGKASDIGIGDYEPIDAVDSWMATLYHRVPILEPGLRSIGFGCARGRRQGWATVMNVQSGRDKGPRPHAVFYPAADQVDVPLNFPNSGEEPNPIPEDKDNRAGYPVTAFFPQKERLQNAMGTLTRDKGEEVPCWFSTPEMPANPKFSRNQDNTVCLIAKDPLAPNTTYHVRLLGTVAGKAWEKKWKFTTQDAGLSAEKAARAVVDRFNQYRSRAGLSDVALDEALSRGCQLHAEYLAKNADVLAKTKASVNDEDPELPWFTAEGLRSARQAFVFTNAPTPVMQIDDLMATFTSRVFLLDPALQRIGFGAAHDVGRGWRCVLDPNGGRGDARIILYPAPNQDNVPLLGFDSIAGAKNKPGFPITVTFPQRAMVGNVQASLEDARKNSLDVSVSTPEKPLVDKLQRNTVAVHPLEILQPGQIHHVTVSAIINGKEWRKSWQFTTTK